MITYDFLYLLSVYHFQFHFFLFDKIAHSCSSYHGTNIFTTFVRWKSMWIMHLQGSDTITCHRTLDLFSVFSKFSGGWHIKVWHLSPVKGPCAGVAIWWPSGGPPSLICSTSTRICRSCVWPRTRRIERIITSVSFHGVNLMVFLRTNIFFTTWIAKPIAEKNNAQPTNAQANYGADEPYHELIEARIHLQ